MLNRLLSYLGLCRHPHISWPLQLLKSGPITVQCFSCNQRIVYDWEHMRLGKALKGYPTSRCAVLSGGVQQEVGS
jgi:hypothetical protein